jgi:hypothetical protein
MQTKEETRNSLLLIGAVVLIVLGAIVMAVGLSGGSDDSHGPDVNRLVDYGMERDQAAEFVESLETLDLTEAEIDQAIREYGQIIETGTNGAGLGSNTTEPTYDSQGLDGDGCSRHEHYDSDTGWCELD